MQPSTTSTGLRGLAATAICGVLALGLSGVCAADPGDTHRTVAFADLDLTNPSDAHVLYRRIRAAAQVVCSSYFFLTDTAKAACLRDATAAAVTRINQAALFAVYETDNRTSLPRGLVSQSR